MNWSMEEYLTELFLGMTRIMQRWPGLPEPQVSAMAQRANDAAHRGLDALKREVGVD